MTATAEAKFPAILSEAINIESLLQPISDGNPAGENLQYAGLYDEIREARREDEALSQGDWKRDRKVADWPRVVTLGAEALATRTKDLQVGAWLTEALVKTEGFAGLRDGLRLMTGLLERFWDHLYPETDEDDIEGRANALSWMDRPLVLPKVLKEVPISKNAGGAGYCYLQVEQSRQFDIPEQLEGLDSEERRRVSELRERAAEEGKITSEQWRVSKAATRRAFYEETHLLLTECSDGLLALCRVIDQKFGEFAPGLADLKKSLDEVRAFVETIVKEKRILEPDPVQDARDGDGGAASISDESAAGSPASGPLQSRQEALKRLAEVAEFFRRTEPHSPVSYLVQRAIRWGRMPLESWLEDVIKNDGVLDHLRETLGLNRGSDGSEGNGS